MTPSVTPVGNAGFSVLKEARGFKGSDENKSFSQELILDREVGMKFVNELQEQANALHGMELEKSKSRGKSVRYAPPIINYKELETGEIKLTFKRKEIDNPPPVVDADNKPFSGLIRRDNKIQVAFRLRPYVMANVFGVTLQLLAVKVVESGMNEQDAAKLFGPSATKPTAKKEPEVSISDLF